MNSSLHPGEQHAPVSLDQSTHLPSDPSFWLSVLGLSSDGICILDKDGIVLYVNDAWLHMQGIVREGILGKPIAPLEKETFSMSCSAIATREKRAITLEQKLLRTKRTILVTCYPLFDAHGEVQYVIANNRDFSALKALELQVQETEKENDKYRRELESLGQLHTRESLIAHDKKMISVLYLAMRVAKVNSSVLITGETGSGKEVIARFIHNNSCRAQYPFVTINCGAIPDSLIESELFGYEKGSFTGADREGRMGLLEAANGGTLFLDEIGELPLSIQVKLLRALQEREIRRIGSRKDVKINVRVISATNRSLEDMVEHGEFRNDLYYRLNVITVRIPPLRERQADIIPLANYFLDLFNKEFDLIRHFSQDAYQAMLSYPWPGNVRELRNAVERAVVMSESDGITREYLPDSNAPLPLSALMTDGKSLPDIMQEIEDRFILDTYRTHRSIRASAEALSIPPTTFARKLRQAQDSLRGEE